MAETDWPPLCGIRTKGLWWFRIFGYGFHFRDHNLYSPLFSERYGYKKRLHIGSWCFGLLRRGNG